MQRNISIKDPAIFRFFVDAMRFSVIFYPASISYMGQLYANSEAAFQAQKTYSVKEQQRFFVNSVCIIPLMQRGLDAT